MTTLVSTHLFLRHRLTTVWLDRVWDAGFPSVEIFCARQHFDYRDKAQINELRYWFRDAPLKLQSLHAPIFSDDVSGRSGPQAVIDITDKSKGKRIAMVDEIKRALEIADVIPVQYLVQHLGVTGQEFDEYRLESAFSSLEELKVFAGQRGVELLLENIPSDLATAKRLNHFLAETHLQLGYCFDIGHAHLTGHWQEEFELMRDRIRSVHIHDNRGEKDEHCFPGEGTIDWANAMTLLRALTPSPALVLELAEPEKMDAPAAEARKTADWLNERKQHEQ